ncbi:ROK family protein [Tellurirhabdus rosea]|uniref:ROK family protein n=1 Tax=Tellurirhabdus rosea TaxID=2674997 RepID=UPI00224E85AB|nr:ROK family protein [Tellurirhabdus rosea]
MNVGIEIGGTKLQVVSGNGQIEQRFRFAVDKAQGATGILEQIERALTQVNGQIDAVGVGFGGPVDGQTGRITTSHQIDGWTGFGLADWLRERTRCPQIRVENDANVAALGEALHGAGRGFRHVFYVTLGSGVGGGMVVGGQIYRGAMPGEAEIGHLRLDRYGKTLESVCSGWAVDREIRRALDELPSESLLKRLVGEQTSGEARFLGEAWARGDGTARRILHRLCDDLAFGLSHVVHLFHPEVIILGGGLSLIGEPLRAGVEKILPDYVMQAFQPPSAIRLAKLGEDVVPMGALSL